MGKAMGTAERNARARVRHSRAQLVEIDAHVLELALHCARIEFEQTFVVALRFSVAVTAPGLRLAERL